MSLNKSSTASSVDAFLLDTCLDTFIYRDLLGSYLSTNCNFLLIFLDLSLDKLVFSPPKTLSLTPNLIPKCFSSFFKFFSSLGKVLLSHFHEYHISKPRFWGFRTILGFFKIDDFLLKFLIGFCLNEFNISCIASH